MKKEESIIIMLLLLVSVVATTSFVSAQDPPDPQLHVLWEVEEDEVTQFENEAQHSEWVFGPQPTIWIGYADNLTDIAENSYLIEVGTSLLINITIPKKFLGENIAMESVQFWGVREGPSAPFFGLEFNATSNRWNSMAFRYLPGQTEPSPADFVTLDSGSCEYEEFDDYYWVVFAITYQWLIAPGVFWTGMQAIDVYNRPVSPSWLSSIEAGGFITPPIGFGTPVDPRAFRLPDYYYGDIVNPDNEIIHFVDVNDTFIVRMMSTAEFGEIFIPFTQLTWNQSLKITDYWPIPVGLDESDAPLFDPDVEWLLTEVELYPTMFLKFNETDTYVLAGYFDVDWSWVELGGGVGMWVPALSCIETSTIALSDYFVINPAYTGDYDERHRVQWGGYFTNLTDLDQGFSNGGTIEPNLGLSMVLDVDGQPITARPEISERQTMKLSFRSGFIEAFLLHEDGTIANLASQGEILNLTMLVHAPMNEVNGSIVWTQGEPPTEFKLDRELVNL
ncbi:MAG: hypothetical protein ACFE7R_11700, partial [Candidatus Hodarchaeota archaeon]